MALRSIIVALCLIHSTAWAASPLMRGTLWWMPYLPKASQGEYARAIQRQRDVGFDLLWLLGTPALFEKALKNEAAGDHYDPLEQVFRIADAAKMRVIVDLPQCGWYGRTKAEEMIGQVARHAEAFGARYGKHASFYGWYLNYEINLIAPERKEESQWWCHVWREEATACHRVVPGSLVTISPFFMMDAQCRRGFVYLAPEAYAAWWEETLRETKIDIVMLQDSGAEHLGFFTLADREPFFAAMQAACRRAGSLFWVNVESAEADVADWDDFLAKEREKRVPWRVVPIERLAAKLELASRYGEEVVNWGYFPYMASGKLEEPSQSQREAYEAYKCYYQSKPIADQP